MRHIVGNHKDRPYITMLNIAYLAINTMRCALILAVARVGVSHPALPE